MRDKSAYDREYNRLNSEKINAQRRRRHAANPEKARAAAKRKKKDPVKHRLRSRRHELRRKYGIEYEQFLALVAKQGGKCGICEKSLGIGLHVDHCHTTKRVRGLLCRSCNIGLGLFQDSPSALLNAARYLVT